MTVNDRIDQAIQEHYPWCYRNAPRERILPGVCFFCQAPREARELWVVELTPYPEAVAQDQYGASLVLCRDQERCEHWEAIKAFQIAVRTS